MIDQEQLDKLAADQEAMKADPAVPESAPVPAPDSLPAPKLEWPSDADIVAAFVAGADAESAMHAQVEAVYEAKKLGQ